MPKEKEGAFNWVLTHNRPDMNQTSYPLLHGAPLSLLLQAIKDNRASFTILFFFKQWEFYEIVCVVCL